jgi:hypothetical protein
MDKRASLFWRMSMGLGRPIARAKKKIIEKSI